MKLFLVSMIILLCLSDFVYTQNLHKVYRKKEDWHTSNWKLGSISFHGATVDDVVSKIEKWFKNNKYLTDVTLTYYTHNKITVSVDGKFKPTLKTMKCDVLIDFPSKWIADTLVDPQSILGGRGISKGGIFYQTFFIDVDNSGVIVTSIQFFNGIKYDGNFNGNRCYFTEMNNDFYTYLKKNVKQKPIKVVKKQKYMLIPVR